MSKNKGFPLFPLLYVYFIAGGPKKEVEDDEGVEPEAPEPFEWPDDI